MFGGADGRSAAADEVAEVVELGAAGEAGLFDLDLDDHGSVEWEDLFDGDLVRGDLADGKGGVVMRSDGDHNSFEDLDTRLFPFLDTLMDADGVADVESNIFVGCLICHEGNYNRLPYSDTIT